MDYYRHLAPFIQLLPAEAAHRLAIKSLARGIVPAQPVVAHDVLNIQVCGLHFSNPVGLAPGFDKNAEAATALFRQGFGFVECGTVTPRPQAGNPKPRLFRLTEDRAVINRMGFNNEGLQALLRRLDQQERGLGAVRRHGGVLGINIGKNKDSEDAAADYVTMLEGVYTQADYITLNISSPNTPGLRDLQASSALGALLDAVCAKRQTLTQVHGRRVPLWLKLAPDLTEEQCHAVADTLEAYPIDAVIISNTTLERPESLKSPHKKEIGGLSGVPLMELSTARLRLFYRLLGHKLPLIGVGGIASPEDAYAKIKAGASLVQVYSALVYQGFELVTHINQTLPSLLQRDGYASIKDAVGVEA